MEGDRRPGNGALLCQTSREISRAHTDKTDFLGLPEMDHLRMLVGQVLHIASICNTNTCTSKDENRMSACRTNSVGVGFTWRGDVKVIFSSSTGAGRG